MTTKLIEKYSLWLMPTGQVFEKLSNLIKDLAGKYESSVFEPHVTLLGGIASNEKEIIQKTENLSQMILPYTIKLEEVSYSEHYFKALFVRVKNTFEVQEAYIKALQIFPEEGPYMAHLSLTYGNFPPNIKQQMIIEVGDRFNEEFLVDRIHLYRTDSDKVEDWYKVQEFKLK